MARAFACVMTEETMDPGRILVFERPPVSRIVSCAASFGSAAIFFMYLAEHANDYELLGKSGDWMRWEDIVEVREVKDKILILLSRDGRRLLVDAILGYAIARAEIVRRAPQAILSGTLVSED